jgi:2,4-dienoyl-CoA reductase-like NADH-dependent reductase (Old Yellow Enzyme family)
MDTNNRTDRWGSWIGRARVCFRVAGAIDSTTITLVATAKEFEAANDDAAREAASALRLAEAALIRAREAVHAALQAKQMTPANREVAYGLQ